MLVGRCEIWKSVVGHMLVLCQDARTGGIASVGEVRLYVTIQKDLICASDLAPRVKARKRRKMFIETARFD